MRAESPFFADNMRLIAQQLKSQTETLAKPEVRTLRFSNIQN